MHYCSMRTSVTFDDDVAAEIQRLRCVSGIGVSKAVNLLIRSGMSRPRERSVYGQSGTDMGQRIDVTAIGRAIEQLDADWSWPSTRTSARSPDVLSETTLER
jgi:hypothetical protein